VKSDAEYEADAKAGRAPPYLRPSSFFASGLVPLAEAAHLPGASHVIDSVGKYETLVAEWTAAASGAGGKA